MKKISLFLVMAIIMVVAIFLFGTSVNATNIIEGNFGEGDCLHWEYDYDTRTLTISGTGAIPDYEYQYGMPWQQIDGEIQTGATGLTTVIIEDGVTRIGDRAFAAHNSLSSVTIPDSVTSIGIEAFKYTGRNPETSNLKSIKLPAALTEIGQHAFGGAGFQSIEIPDSVEIIGRGAFSGSDLTAITIPDGVKIIGEEAFQSCTELEVVVIGENVEEIGRCAFGFTKIQSISIPRSVKTLGTAIFNWCDNLDTIIYEGTEEQWNAMANGVNLGVQGVSVVFEPKWYVTYDLNGGSGKNEFEPQRIKVDDKFEDLVPTWDEIKDYIEAPYGKVYTGVEINGKKVNIGENFVVIEDVKIKLLWEDKYKILEGDNQTYTLGTNTDIVIKANGDVSKIKSIEIDGGNVIDPSKYVLTSGSTILTLKSSFLEASSIGQHTITFKYDDGEANATLTIAQNNNNENTNNNTPNNATTNETTNDNTKNPKTADNIMTYFITLLISLMGMVSGIMYINKNKLFNR